MLVSFGQFPMFRHSKFEGNVSTTTKFRHCGICKVTNAFKPLKLLGMVLIKFPFKNNDFNFARFPKFESNPIPSPAEYLPMFK
jgi:hypothetical protein